MDKHVNNYKWEDSFDKLDEIVEEVLRVYEKRMALVMLEDLRDELEITIQKLVNENKVVGTYKNTLLYERNVIWII